MLVRPSARQRELEVLYADAETEFARDVWDLRKVGLASRAQHGRAGLLRRSRRTGLREAAKGWARARADLARRRTSLQGVLLAVGLLSESLALARGRRATRRLR